MTIEQNKEITNTEIKNLGIAFNAPVGRDPYVLRGLLRRWQTLAITAPRKSLKTSLAIQLALSLVSNTSWLEWETIKECNVLFINVNNSENLCFEKFSRCSTVLEISKEDMQKIDIVSIKKTFRLKEVVDLLMRKLNKTYRAVIIDSLDDLKLSNNADWNETTDATLTRLKEHFKCSLIFTQSHRHRPVGNDETRELAEWSDSLNYSDSLLEFVKMNLDPELLRRERLEAVWELSKNVMNTHNRSYYLMNITDRYIEKEKSTCEELRNHVEIALGTIPERNRKEILKDFDAIDIPIKNRTYWRMETVTNEQPQEIQKDFLFYYPELKHDRKKILAFHEPGRKLPKKYLDRNKIDDTEKTHFTNLLTNAIEEFRKQNGRQPNQKELSKFLGKDRTTVKRWVDSTDGEIFLGPKGYDFM